MSSFTFPSPYDDPDETAEQETLAQRRLRECIVSVQESMRQAKEEEKRIANAKNRIITFRMPIELLSKLDIVAEDAATSRGHMLRQIVAEYMCYVEECDIRYNGSLLTAHPSKRKR